MPAIVQGMCALSSDFVWDHRAHPPRGRIPPRAVVDQAAIIRGIRPLLEGMHVAPGDVTPDTFLKLGRGVGLNYWHSRAADAAKGTSILRVRVDRVAFGVKSACGEPSWIGGCLTDVSVDSVARLILDGQADAVERGFPLPAGTEYFVPHRRKGILLVRHFICYF